MTASACRVEAVDPSLELAPSSLGEIVGACWDGRALGEGELREAVCALSLLLARDQQALQRLATGELECKAPMRDYSAVYQREAQTNRMSQALLGSPREILEDGGELGNPSQRARRQVLAMLSNFMNWGLFR